MPNIKPLSKLVTKARTIRDDHRARHATSGFAFALADSIDYLDQNHWARVTSHNSMFFSPRYLRVLEDAGPENLRSSSVVCCTQSTITKSHRNEIRSNNPYHPWSLVP